MTEETAIPSGDSLERPVADREAEPDRMEEKPDNVSWETHRKLLGEKKRLQESFRETQERLQALETEAKERAETELKQQNRYKELWEQEKERAAKYESDLKSQGEEIQNAFKLDAFRQALGNRTIDRKYYGFIDTGKILMDPETGNVDSTSLQKEIERIQETFPEIVRPLDKRPLPSDYPAGSGSKLSYEEWKTLPLAEKKKRLPEMMAARQGS